MKDRLDFRAAGCAADAFHAHAYADDRASPARPHGGGDGRPRRSCRPDGEAAEALEGMGHGVAIADATAARVTGWDIVHAFGAPWRFRHVLREARQAGSTVAISPIMWPYRSALTVRGRIGAGRIRTAEVDLLGPAPRWTGTTAAELSRPSQETAMTLELADLVLPNSTSEAERIRSTFGVTIQYMSCRMASILAGLFAARHSGTARRGGVRGSNRAP